MVNSPWHSDLWPKSTFGQNRVKPELRELAREQITSNSAVISAIFPLSNAYRYSSLRRLLSTSGLDTAYCLRFLINPINRVR